MSGSDRIRCVISALFAGLAHTAALADAPKELNTRPGVPVLLLQLVNPRPDCSASPGPVALPSVTRKPNNGNLLLQVVSFDAKSAACPDRKTFAIAVFYAPKKDFRGKDEVEFDIEIDNRIASPAYRISVQ